MATTPKTSKSRGMLTPDSFQVVQVLGTVQLDKYGSETPDLAAYRLVSEHGLPGTFEFPNIHGGTTTVTVGDVPTTMREEGDARGGADNGG